jgi:hypothetical protein
MISLSKVFERLGIFAEENGMPPSLSRRRANKNRPSKKLWTELLPSSSSQEENADSEQHRDQAYRYADLRPADQVEPEISPADEDYKLREIVRDHITPRTKKSEVDWGIRGSVWRFGKHRSVTVSLA